MNDIYVENMRKYILPIEVYRIIKVELFQSIERVIHMILESDWRFISGRRDDHRPHLLKYTLLLEKYHIMAIDIFISENCSFIAIDWSIGVIQLQKHCQMEAFRLWRFLHRSWAVNGCQLWWNQLITPWQK